MAIEHDSIGNGEIHEPKGVSTAPARQVYVSDGLGSGSWTTYAAGNTTDTTDGSGDIIVATGTASLVDAKVVVTVKGTNPYHTTVHTPTALGFSVRFFDFSGAAVTSTAVEIDWAVVDG